MGRLKPVSYPNIDRINRDICCCSLTIEIKIISPAQIYIVYEFQKISTCILQN